MSVLPMRKWAQELQAAPLCAGKAGAEVSFSGSSPLPQGSCLPHARSPPITWCREVSGDSFRVTGSVGHPRAKMSWRHHWGWGRVVGAWASLLLPGLPLSNHLSHGSAGLSLHNPADPRPLLTPNTSTHLVSWCPGGWLSLESLYQVGPSHCTHQDLRVWTSGERGRGEGAGEERRGGKGRGGGRGLHYEDRTCVSTVSGNLQQPMGQETEAQRHREVNCFTQGPSASAVVAR